MLSDVSYSPVTAWTYLRTFTVSLSPQDNISTWWKEWGQLFFLIFPPPHKGWKLINIWKFPFLQRGSRTFNNQGIFLLFPSTLINYHRINFRWYLHTYLSSRLRCIVIFKNYPNTIKSGNTSLLHTPTAENVGRILLKVLQITFHWF